MLGGNPNRSDSTATNLLYCGEYFDTDHQQYYLRARWYNTDIGRFNRLDSFAGNKVDPQSLHKYLYAHCNPVNAADPNGNLSLMDVVLAAGIVGLIVGLLLPAETFGERITNGLMLGFACALIADMAIVATAVGILSISYYFGISLVSGELLITLMMIAAGGTTFAAGTKNSYFAKQINRVNSLFRWGYKTAGNQTIKVTLSRAQYPQYADRIERTNKTGPFTLDRVGAVARRRAALRGTLPKTGLHRDEWPPAISAEGGAGVDIQYMSPNVNQSAGAAIGNQLRPYSDGNRFEIKIVD